MAEGKESPSPFELSTLGKFNKSMDIRMGVIHRILSNRIGPDPSLMIIDRVIKSEVGKITDIFFNRFLNYEIKVKEGEEGKKWSPQKRNVFMRSQNNMRYIQEQDDFIWTREDEESCLNPQLVAQDRYESAEVAYAEQRDR